MDALRSHGYMKESLRLAVAIVRSLKHQQRVNKDRCRYQNEGTDLLMRLMAVVHFKHCIGQLELCLVIFIESHPISTHL